MGQLVTKVLMSRESPLPPCVCCYFILFPFFFNFRLFINLRVKVGLGKSRTNADSKRNPLYNVFHRNFCCGNETIRR